MSKKKPNTEIKEVISTDLVPVEPVEDEVVEETAVKIVFTTAKLNVRKLPSKDSKVVRILEKDVPVEIDETESTKDWYKLTDGFIMKEFTRED